MKSNKAIEKVKGLCHRIDALESLDKSPSLENELEKAYQRMGDIINAELDKCVSIKLSDLRDLKNEVERIIKGQEDSSAVGVVYYRGWLGCLDYLIEQLDR